MVYVYVLVSLFFRLDSTGGGTRGTGLLPPRLNKEIDKSSLHGLISHLDIRKIDNELFQKWKVN